MKLVLDQNLSHKLAEQLSLEFSGSGHVRDFGMSGMSDAAVWAFAAAEGFVIVSKDADFQQRALLLGHPPKVIWLRVGNCPTAAIETLLRFHRATLLAFEADPLASFIALA